MTIRKIYDGSEVITNITTSQISEALKAGFRPVDSASLIPVEGSSDYLYKMWEQGEIDFIR